MKTYCFSRVDEVFGRFVANRVFRSLDRKTMFDTTCVSKVNIRIPINTQTVHDNNDAESDQIFAVYPGRFCDFHGKFDVYSISSVIIIFFIFFIVSTVMESVKFYFNKLSKSHPDPRALSMH